MSRGSKSKIESVRSSLLSPQENEKLEELLGRRCAVSFQLTGEGIAQYETEALLCLSWLISLLLEVFIVKVKGEAVQERTGYSGR